AHHSEAASGSATGDQTSTATTQRTPARTEIRLPPPGRSALARPSVSALLRLEWSAGPPAPIFPGAVDAVRPGAGENLVHLAGGQELDLAHVHGLLLQPRINLEVNRNIDRLPDVLARHGCTVTAHQRGAAGAHALREVAAHVHVLDQQCGVAETVMGIPDRHFVADRCAHMEDGFDLLAGHSEWNDAFAVIVHDRHEVRARLVERAVDESLEIGRPTPGIDGRTVERELHDVVALDAVGRARTR